MKNAKAGPISGFTLIELLVVVLIIGILVSVALPQYEKAVEKSRATQALALLKSYGQAFQSYYLANGSYPSSFDQLDVDVPWTGTEKWYNMASDSRSNGEWSLQILYHDTSYSGIYIGRLKGDYKGGGFGFLGKNISDYDTDSIICLERISGGVVFSKTQGDYCNKLFGASYQKTSGGTRFFRMQ